MSELIRGGKLRGSRGLNPRGGRAKGEQIVLLFFMAFFIFFFFSNLAVCVECLERLWTVVLALKFFSPRKFRSFFFHVICVCLV